MRNNIFLLLILLVAICLRFINIGKYGIGGDEKYALLVSQFISQEGGGQQEVFNKENNPYFTNIELNKTKTFFDFQKAIAHRDNGSGLVYDLLLHFWIKVFGYSDMAVRSMSVVMNLLTLVLLFYFTRLLTSKPEIALIAVFLAAISPFLITISQVARGYSLLYLLALLSSYLFIYYLKKSKTKYLVLYSLVVLMALQTHYSIFPLFALHGLYLLIFHLNYKTIAPFALAMVLPFLGMILWLSMPGGEWAIHSIKISAKVYSEMAKESTTPWLSIATFSNVAKQLFKVFTFTTPLVHNLSETIIGLKNIVCSFFCGGIISYLLIEKRININLKYLVIVILLAIVYLLVSVNSQQFVFFTLLLGILGTFVSFSKPLDKFYIFCFIIVAFSFLFLVVFAIQDGNTMRLIPRYAGYGYAFSCILIAKILYSLLHKKRIIQVLTLLTIGFSVYNYSIILNQIYADRAPNYFHQFPEKRIQNPYYNVANVVCNSFVKGDTLLHSSVPFIAKMNEGAFNANQKSVQDAQYLNIYLAECDKEIIQRINYSEPNKVFLKHKDGTSELLFDFQGNKYRY